MKNTADFRGTAIEDSDEVASSLILFYLFGTKNSSMLQY